MKNPRNQNKYYLRLYVGVGVGSLTALSGLIVHVLGERDEYILCALGRSGNLCLGIWEAPPVCFASSLRATFASDLSASCIKASVARHSGTTKEAPIRLLHLTPTELISSFMIGSTDVSRTLHVAQPAGLPSGGRIIQGVTSPTFCGSLRSITGPIAIKPCWYISFCTWQCESILIAPMRPGRQKFIDR